MIDADRIQDLKKSMRYSLKYTVVLAILLIFIISSFSGCIGDSGSEDDSDDSSDLYESYQMSWNDSHEWMTVMGTTYQNNTMLEINNSAFVNFHIDLEMRLAPVPFNPEGFLNFTITKTSDNDTDESVVVWSEEWVGENANIMTYNMSMTMPLLVEDNTTVQLDFVIRALGRDSSISGGSQDYFINNLEVMVTEVGDLTEMQTLMEMN
jgi:hypothetical protein